MSTDRIHDLGMIVSGLLVADTGFGHMDDFGHMSGWGWGLGIVGLIVMLALIGLIVWLIVAATQRGGPGRTGARSALDVLDDRYARGEIDRKDYLERRADLQEPS